MGFFSFFRSRREPQQVPNTPPVEQISTANLVNSMMASQIELWRVMNESQLETLKATADERQEEREYRRKVLENKRAAAAHARDVLAKKKAGTYTNPQQGGNCKLCANIHAIDITPADVDRHYSHAAAPQRTEAVN